MTQCPSLTGDATLVFIDEIPVIGTKHRNRRRALRVIKQHMDEINEITGDEGAKLKIVFKKQPDGRYRLGIAYNKKIITFLGNVDELLLKRFRKSILKKSLFILTGFVEGENGELECLVLTEGLGTVIYSPEKML